MALGIMGAWGAGSLLGSEHHAAGLILTGGWAAVVTALILFGIITPKEKGEQNG